MPTPYDHEHENEVVPFAATNFRGEERKFGIKTDDRRRHIYIIGKTGMGKTTLLENMVLHDINAGHGVAYIDPHGDTADKMLDHIPPHRVNDVVYFNPADLEFPVGFNILEVKDENEKHLVAAGLMGVFKKIWEGVWSPRMEYILLNCALALLDTPGSTMMGISRILADKEYRKKIVDNIKDPVVKSFWVNEYANYTDRFASEAIAPVQNKVGQFLSANITRNIVAQTRSTFDLREIMDERKILIANLSKGKMGEDASRLFGGMLITRLQLAAMERVGIPEADRQDFYLYVDEFQNFATESFANILSEARKYHLNLVTAHQYIEQLDETVAAAIFGNVGTIISFRVGATDAEALAKEYAPVFTEEDIINLAKFEIYLKLMIDGVASNPFSAKTLPPIATLTESREKVVQVSRERYATKREVIEEKVKKWSEFMEAQVGIKRAAKKSKGSDSFGPSADRTHKANCSRCGKELFLKFAPDPSRPFYCKECLPFARAEAVSKPPAASPGKPSTVSRPPSASAGTGQLDKPKSLPKPPTRKKTVKKRPPPPPPPKEGMFSGKVRIAKDEGGEDKPSVVLKTDAPSKRKEKKSEAELEERRPNVVFKSDPPKPKPPESKKKTERKKPDNKPAAPKKLSPGETAKFD